MKLNLGCGLRKMEGFENIDKRPEVKPDKCVDIARLGLPYDDDSVEEVWAIDFLEHIEPDRVIFVVEEIWRVLKHGRRLFFNTPSTDGRGAFQDPTHRSFWNFNSWIYFVDDAHRAQIGTKANFDVAEMEDVWSGMQVCHTRGSVIAIKVFHNPVEGEAS